ncbi:MULTISPECIES: hypothetical protein [Methylorubrum]|uniref:Uncharacterized protein n=2 Tax=Methylorubrum extorquens TaxID=408 RepID=C5AZR5_METEA|nr:MULTISPECIES: hypothetical protein [Methylorubrum]ACS41439.1 Hypothetical protein MexAM1_META1p3729 [Methylorubrum extorquens AM1]EHP92073.1 hypothetical protein MetexDRAFT_3037 [Methylorubrum extorquens DSM 13060]MCP1540379.1 hypothetical protein [Methylorubrum extorquens]MCP1587084.1 hypothetical protein [Methylorubrum extorquens]BDL40880.1 hypothetical protein MSPGM_34700 [Methylorubrum sp. GM97]
MAPDPAFHVAQRQVSIEVFGVIARFIAANRDLPPFHGMYQGFHFLMRVILLREADAQAALRESDFSDIVTQFGVSRSHVRNFLAAAEAGGLLTGAVRGWKHLGPTPRGLSAVDRFIADALASHDLTYRMARGWRRSRPGRQTRHPDPAAPVDGGRPQVRAPLIRRGPALGAMLSMTGMSRPPTWPPPA